MSRGDTAVKDIDDDGPPSAAPTSADERQLVPKPALIVAVVLVVAVLVWLTVRPSEEPNMAPLIGNETNPSSTGTVSPTVRFELMQH